MSLRQPSTWFAALLVALAVIVPFQRQLRPDAGSFALEVRASADHAGHIQLYYNRGHGYTETDSSTLPLPAGSEPATYRLALPRGTFDQLRLDPTDRDGTVLLSSLRVVDRDGRIVREISLGAVQPGANIQALRPGPRGLAVVVTPGSNDPYLYVPFAPALELQVTWGQILGPYCLAAGLVWVALLAGCWIADRSVTLRASVRRSWLRNRERPLRSIVIVGAFAVLLSSYPVLFLGKSFVSPNLGTQLLYDEFPTLPGYDDPFPVNAHGSDVGAIMWQQVPYSAVQHRSIFWHAEWPLWIRANAGGTPLLGQGQSMLGDPFHLLVVAAGGSAWAWDAKYLVAKWLLAVGLGWSVWCLTRHRGAAMITALAAPFCGFFLYRLNHPAFFSFCYAPWILWAWFQVAQAPRPRATARALGGLVAANWLVLNSGTVKEAFALLFVMNLGGAVSLLGAAAPWRTRLVRLGAAAGAGLLFAGLSSPFWFTFWETLRTATTASDSPLAWQIQPSLLLGFFDEAFYRPLTPGNLVFNPGANFLIGAGVLYFCATLRDSVQHRLVWGVLAAAGLSAALVFGAVPPGLICEIPFLANIHHIDNSLSCALILLCAVLAGVGYATADRRLRTAAGRADLLVSGLLLAGMIGAYLGFTDAAHRSFFGTIYPTMTVWGPNQSLALDPFVRGYLASLVTALVVGSWLLYRTLRRGVLTTPAALGLAVCTAALLWRGGQLAGGVGWPGFSYRPGPRVNFGARSTAEKTVEQTARAAPIRAVGLQGNFFPGWTAEYERAETVSGPDAVSNRYYRELTDAMGLPRIWDWRIYLTRDVLAAARPMLDVLNVRDYLDLRSDQGELGAVLKLDQLSDLDIYESRTAWPRAFFTDRVETYRQPADLVALLRRRPGPLAAVQTGEAGAETLAPLESPARSAAAPLPAAAYRLTENSTAFTIDAPHAGIAVLTETYWDGYPHARVDGRPAAALRINHAFIGVPVPPGSHRVEVRYRPRYFDVTLLIAAGSALLLALSGFAAYRLDPITE